MWVSDSPSLCLSFLTCKMGAVIPGVVVGTGDDCGGLAWRELRKQHLDSVSEREAQD